MRARPAGLLLGMALLSTASSAQGTAVERLTVVEMTARADRVVRGIARGLNVVALEGGHRAATLVEVEVVEDLKGGPGPVVVAVPGGDVGATRVRVEGAARLTPGDEAVLFLEWSAPVAAFVPVAMASSVFHVERVGGVAVVRRHMEGLSFAVRPPGQGVRMERAPHPDAPDTLDALRGLVLGALGRAR